MSTQNKTQELDHARKILHNPEFYWNSATLAGRNGSLRRAEWVKRVCAFRPGLRVLEVGSGTGFFSEVFHPTGAELIGIDISPELVQIAKERCPDIRFQVCDVESMPFEDQSFDCVVGIRVLHHLDLPKALQEIRRVLKMNGRIAFCEPNMLNPQIMIQKNIPWVKRVMGDTPDETAFFKWQMRKFLKLRDFESIEIEPFDFLHPWIPKTLVPAVTRVGSWLEQTPGIREIAGSLSITALKG